ncbi:MAG TPA: hypothetical protein VLD86_03835, partial [Ilumatobacteraceae bacterium]|nr:hypothetical protein [Ilumatobacteraceae bacterium]
MTSIVPPEAIIASPSAMSAADGAPVCGSDCVLPTLTIDVDVTTAPCATEVLVVLLLLPAGAVVSVGCVPCGAVDSVGCVPCGAVDSVGCVPCGAVDSVGCVP